MGRPAPWWCGGVLYHVYVRSFADSNGDGVGDLRGLRERLPYLEWLGVDGVWLSPITVSPDRDWGYDVADYCDVQPVLGDLAELEGLSEDAGSRGIRVLLDLVPNHTSDLHHWFRDARSERHSRHRDWYVWADGRDDGLPPNNWVSVFGGPAWTFDERTDQYYLHNFLAAQPDLNWWNDEVRDAFDAILRFWFDRGVAGFRIDVAHGIVKDRELRDNPPAGDDADEWDRERGQLAVYNMNRPEVHDVLRRFRRVADEYQPARVLLGETWAPDLPGWAAFYGSGDDELHMAFNFPFAFSRLAAEELRPIVEDAERAIPVAGWPVWTLSNHDIGRFPTRMASEDDARVRCALLALLTLRGTPVLYYGDEIGMPSVEIPRDRVLDVAGRDHCRTPMQWSSEPGAGFSPAGVEPWLPLGDFAACNVADQRDDPRSVLSFCRRLIALRRELADLRDGAYVSLDAPPGVWAWRRGGSTSVAVNLSDEHAAVGGLTGRVALGTGPARDREPVTGSLALSPWEGVVLSEPPR